MKLIDSEHTKLLSKAMDAYALRQRAISSNVSNIETPGYKTIEVPFEEELEQAKEFGKLSKRDIDELPVEMEESNKDVLLEDEMMKLADTQIRVQMVARSLRHSFTVLRQGITGRST